MPQTPSPAEKRKEKEIKRLAEIINEKLKFFQVVKTNR